MDDRSRNAGHVDDGFVRHALRASAPLLVWAIHFFGCYAIAAAACTRMDAGARGGNPSGPHGLLLAASVAALALCAWLLVRAWRRSDASLSGHAARLCALLALIGVAWTAVPLLMLPLCR